MLRTLREEPKYREQLEALAVDVERLDDVMTGLYFAICKNPEIFPVVNGVISVAKTDVYQGAPAIRLFFTYNAEEVHFLCIEFINDL